MKPQCLLTGIVVLSVTLGGGVAAAQTVIVRSAQPGSAVELQVNAEAAKATADANGDATLTVAALTGNRESDEHIYVDACDMLVRVQLLGAGAEPTPPGAGCNRNDLGQPYVMRRVTTFVVDLSGRLASVHFIQGPAPRSWLVRGEAAESAPVELWPSPPTGLMLFGGGGLANFANAANTACAATASATACSGSNFTGAFAVGAMYWITRNLGVQAMFAMPMQATASGSGEVFTFSSTLDSRVVTVAGTVGVPLGPVRLYALAGGNHHQVTFTTNETLTNVLAGSGTQAFSHQVVGWSWVAGGGAEAWITRFIGLYVEGHYVSLKADDVGQVDGGIDNYLTFAVAGARFHLGR